LRNKKLVIIALTIIFLLTNNHKLKADYINLTGAQLSSTIAEYYVDDDGITLKLEIGERDQDAFKGLINGDEDEREEYLRNIYKILDEKGNIIKGNVNIVETRKRVERPSPFKKYPGNKKPSDLVKYVEIEYRFNKKPVSLTFNPPVDEKGTIWANIGFIVYHKLIPVIDFRFLAPNLKLNLDWNDPWYSKFENRTLKRHHESSLMSFLYIEPFEVRHEILLRLKDMENWIDLGIKDSDKIDLEQQQIIKQKLAEFFLKRNELKIDGQVAKPIVDRVQFVQANLMGIQVLENEESIDYLSSLVGIILAYVTDGIPNEVSVDWDMFSEKIQRIPTNAIDPAGPFPSYVLPDDNVVVWKNFLKNYKIPEVSAVMIDESKLKIMVPVISTFLLLFLLTYVYVQWKRLRDKKSVYYVCVVGIVFIVLSIPFFNVSINNPLLSYSNLNKRDSEFLINNLLKNVYRSFDFKNEEDIYDKLAVSLDGDLLRDIYIQTKKGMEIVKQGGARAKVKSVELKEFSSKPLQGEFGYQYHCIWDVSGTVEHWGHRHVRTNQYEANLIIKPIENRWKITDIDLIEEKRIKPI